ncbi:MAG TPA: sigma-70 family RNA polymerase sigma factor [Acidimicrobiales bacterium]|nr:sigma-70 family RNA polymerase sigma factor [Acidimicrobiales bacterium]
MTREAEDDALLAGMAAGDRAAAALFVRRHASAVTGVAYQVVRDRAVAEDVAQETFLRAWKAAATYDPRRGSAKAWLLSISRNAAIDLVRVRRAAPLSPEAVTGLLDGESMLSAPDDRLMADADAAEVRQALRRLPEDQRRALLLAAVAGRSAAEVGELEGIPLGTAKTRIRTALTRMRDYLQVEARRGV